MAAQDFVVYDKTLEYLFDNTIDVDDHTFKTIYLDNSYTPNTASHSAVSNLSSAEISASDGTSLRQTLSNVTWAIVDSSGTSVVRFDADDATVSTSSTVRVRYAAVFDDNGGTEGDKKIVAVSELTTTGSGVAVTQLTLVFSNRGIFKVKRQ